jgi:enoyl-CoA hydratase/carnithine racemase
MESILLKRDGAIATVTLNRPFASNVFEAETVIPRGMSIFVI